MKYFILTIAIATSIAPSCMAERYAFLVAVQQYRKTELNSLRYTERDIIALRNQLLKSGYKMANIVTLTQSLGAKDDRYLPMANNIRTELGLVLKELTSNDSIVLAFSGHGVQFKNEKDAYFCPMNARLSDRRTLVSIGKVFNVLADPKKCRAESRVLLVDACRNNPRTELSKSIVPIELEPVGLRAPEPTGGVVAFYSCSKGQRSWESPSLKHGVFFNYVIRALEGDADFDGDGTIDVPELEKFVTKRVQRYARVKFAKSQTPERRGSSRGIIELAMSNPKSVPDTTIASILHGGSAPRMSSGVPSLPLAVPPANSHNSKKENKIEQFKRRMGKSAGALTHEHLDTLTKLISRHASGEALSKQQEEFKKLFEQLMFEGMRETTFSERYSRVKQISRNRKLGLIVFGDPINGIRVNSAYGAAARAGIKPGDLVVNFGSLSEFPTNAEKLLVRLPNGRSFDLTAVQSTASASLPKTKAAHNFATPAEQAIWNRLGIQVEEWSDYLEVVRSNNPRFKIGSGIAKGRYKDQRGKYRESRIATRNQLASFLRKHNSGQLRGIVGRNWTPY